MKHKTLLTLVIGLNALILSSGCSHGQCSNLPQREAALAKEQSAQVAANEADTSRSLTPSTPKKSTTTNIIQIFKDSGEKQCGEAAATPIDKVKEGLTKNKVRVLDARTQNDGLMHTQSCGSPTGQIHVFTIQKADLKRATALGFKIFNKN